ncbi:MAG: B12-binding domain-containing radical SAM protein, partial [Phycisphaerales bacterium]
MRILLVQPDAPPGVGFRTVALPEPLHLEMVAATVPDHDVRILDMRIDDDLDAALRDFSPEMVGVTALTPEVYAA